MLQAYRGIFITAESILFGIGVVVAASDVRFWLVALMGALGIVLAFVWMNVSTARGRAVSFFQREIRRAESGAVIRGAFSRFKEWQDTAVKEQRTITREVAPSSTRLWMNYILPIVFMLLWVVLILARWGNAVGDS